MRHVALQKTKHAEVVIVVIVTKLPYRRRTKMKQFPDGGKMCPICTITYKRRPKNEKDLYQADHRKRRDNAFP